MLLSHQDSGIVLQLQVFYTPCSTHENIHFYNKLLNATGQHKICPHSDRSVEKQPQRRKREHCNVSTDIFIRACITGTFFRHLSYRFRNNTFAIHIPKTSPQTAHDLTSRMTLFYSWYHISLGISTFILLPRNPLRVGVDAMIFPWIHHNLALARISKIPNLDHFIIYF